MSSTTQTIPTVPQKIWVALRHSSDITYGYPVVADKEHTKYCQNFKARAKSYAGPASKEMYIDNKPLMGFRVISYADSGMLIEHPEGFSVYITPYNMFDLIRTCTIVNGNIDNKLYFNKELKLISEVSEILAEDIAYKNELAKSRDMAKSLKFSDEFYIGKTKYIFITRQHVLSTTSSYNSEPRAKSTLQTFAYNTKKFKYEMIETVLPNIETPIKAGTHFSTEEVAIEEAIAEFSKSDLFICTRKKPIKSSDLKYRFIPCHISEIVPQYNYPKISVIALGDDKYEFFGGVVKPIQYKTWSGTSYSYELIPFSEIGMYKTQMYKTNLDLSKGFHRIGSELYSSPRVSTGIFNLPLDIESLNTGYLEYYL